MERLSRRDVEMELARIISLRGTCERLQVGVVFSRDGRIISTGYNGAPAGARHCVHPGDETPEGGCKVAGHAEANGIAFAARHGLSLEGSTASTTHMPCYNCAVQLINAGVERVIFDLPYRDRSGVELLSTTGIEVVDFNSREVVG